MFGGNRRIILALVGWLILAASPKHEAASDDQTYSDRASVEALQGIASAIRQAKEPPERDVGCKPGEDDRKSDLCAQWKAADAAKESTDWTRRTFWLGVFGAVVGAATLIAAGFAALYAKKAAIETEKGAQAALSAVEETREANAIARDAMLNEGRPWIFAESISTNVMEWRMGQATFTWEFKVVNHGGSLAIVDHIEAGLSFSDVIPTAHGYQPEEIINGFAAHIIRHPANYRTHHSEPKILRPNEALEFSNSSAPSMNMEDISPELFQIRQSLRAWISPAAPNWLGFWLLGEIHYRDARNRKLKTRFCYRLTFSGGDLITEEGGEEYNYRT